MDANDALRAGGRAKVRKIYARAKPRPIAEEEDTATIVVRPTIIAAPPKMKEVNDAAIAALGAGTTTLYARSGRLVRIDREVAWPSRRPRPITRAIGTPTLLAVTPPTLAEELAACASFATPRGFAIAPPGWCVNGVIARGVWPGLRELVGLVEHPVLLADGSMAIGPGYHEASGLYVADGLPVPEHATLAEAEAAVATLLDALIDFPFETAEHRSAWLAGLLTPLVAYAHNGNVPLFLIDANKRGAGKSLLVDLIAVILTGRPMTRMANPATEEEARKSVTSLCLAGDPLVLIDNVVGEFGTPSLDIALTGRTAGWRDRLLRTNDMVTLPLPMTWFATGNNAALRADTTRRTLHVRLRTPEEHPEDRTGFKYPSLLAWAQEQRPRLLTAALTILHGFVDAGRPCLVTPWGSFEAWSGWVRGALVWAGQPDPIATRDALRRGADQESGTVRLLLRELRAWMQRAKLRHFLVRDVLSAIAEPCAVDCLGLRDAVQALADAGRPVSSQLLGKRFDAHRASVFGGLALDRVDDPHAKQARWYIIETEHFRADADD